VHIPCSSRSKFPSPESPGSCCGEGGVKAAAERRGGELLRRAAPHVGPAEERETGLLVSGVGRSRWGPNTTAGGLGRDYLSTDYSALVPLVFPVFPNCKKGSQFALFCPSVTDR
jgi:hypothetical protein